MAPDSAKDLKKINTLAKEKINARKKKEREEENNLTKQQTL